MSENPSAVPPLRGRLPGYLAAFAVGLAAGAVVGVVIWLATTARLVDAVGYTYSALGALLLLVGGIRGSGYSASTSTGAGAPAQGGTPDRAGRLGGVGRMDPVERRRRRLLSPPNPAAFWQVVAGCAYLVIGVLLTVLLAAPAG